MNTNEKLLKYKNLVEAIQDKQDETTRGITFVEGEEEERFVSYGHLYERALALLFHMQNRGMKPGDELVFQMESNSDFVFAFWACLLGHIVPVPVTPAANDRFKSKLFSIWKSLNNPYLITSKTHLDKLERLTGEDNLGDTFDHIKRNTIFIDELGESQEKGNIYYPGESDIAFIQFSSGSTNQSRGVVLTHKNLITTMNAIIKGIRFYKKDDIGISWMPLTHDMGLIGFHLTPTSANLNHFIMPTALFIRYPSLWLKKISQHQITITSSPNFGYKHVLRFFDLKKMPGLELSSIRIIFNGAEPISMELCNQFLEEMAPFGLKRNTMFPVYGLAEASLAVSFPEPGQEMKAVYVERSSININRKVKEVDKDNGLSFVEVGTAVDGCYIKIADDSGREVGDRVVGRILIKGDNVTSGYYNNREATDAVIDSDGWLDTGDLGFLRDGRLVITGRVKDTLFANGHTYFAHDIENAAEELPGFKINRTAVVGVFNHRLHSDEIICFVLYKKNDIKEFLALALELKKWVVKKVGVGISRVIPVKQIPITTSGKIQHYKLKEAYLNGEFDPILKEIAALLERN